MTARHHHRSGDWHSVAVRIDELLSARGGDDPFDDALVLLVAKLAHEAAPDGPFLRDGRNARTRVAELLARARARWPGILDPAAGPRADEATLRHCCEILEGEDLSTDRVGLDAVFEALSGRSARGRKGQFFTPRHVVAAIVAMVDPRAGERVVDPACGSGGFLHHALAHDPGCDVWGFDLDPRAVRTARVLLAAAGAPASHVQRLDALEPGTIEQAVGPRGVDVILTNPPFAGDVADAYGPSEMAPGRRVERDLRFVERCVGLLRPGGRLGIVLPHGSLANARWATARAWLLARVQVTAVIGLGRNTFQPHTGQKATVLVGRKRPHTLERAPPDEEILFFVSERDGKDARGRLVLRPDGGVDHDLHEVVPEVRRRAGTG